MNTARGEPEEKIDFPAQLSGETIPFHVTSPLGLFGYRISQAIQLLEWPEFNGLEAVSQEERKRIKDDFLQLRHPITALALFLGVVALEDFGRDLLQQLRGDDFVVNNFREFQNLTPKDIEHEFKHLCSKNWNRNFSRVFGFKPILAQEFSHIRDLVTLRNAIAHYGSLTPEKYRNRFKYWDVKIGHPINPPASFVRAELDYIFHRGQKIHEETRRVVFQKIIEKIGCGWSKDRNSDILRLIALFGFFGYEEEAKGPTGLPPMDPNLQDLLKQDFPDLLEQAQLGRKAILRRLQSRCIDKLVAEFGA